MAHTAPLTGARIPDSGDSANIAQYFDNLGKDLDAVSVPQFTSTAARDAAWAAWVAAGHTLTQAVSLVNGDLQAYRGGQWVSTMPHKYRRVAATASGTLNGAVALCGTQTIPASPFGTSVNYMIDVDCVTHATSIPSGFGVKLEISFDGVVQDGDDFNNGGASACKYTPHARGLLTVGDNSSHTVSATITSQGVGTITLDGAYARMEIAMRPFISF